MICVEKCIPMQVHVFPIFATMNLPRMKKPFLLVLLIVIITSCRKNTDDKPKPDTGNQLLLTSIIDVNANSPDTLHIEKFMYDENNRRIKETSVNPISGDNAVLSYIYDGNGNLSAVYFDSAMHGTSFTYQNNVPLTQSQTAQADSVNSFNTANGKVTGILYYGSPRTRETITYQGKNIINVKDNIGAADSVIIAFKYGSKKDIYNTCGFKWYYGYQYPYLPLSGQNEIIEQDITLPDGTFLKQTYTYEYNTEGYPVQYTMYNNQGVVNGRGYYTYKEAN